MKKIAILTGALAASTLSSQAAVTLLYSENFDSPAFTTLLSGNAVNYGGVAPNVGTGDWFHSADVAAGSDTLNFTAPTNDNRFRGAAVWLDTTGWVSGEITVTLGISNYTAAVGPGYAYLQTYTASGVDGTNAAGIDLQSAANGGVPTLSGGATPSTLGAQTAITAAGTLVHTFTYSGEDEIALLFGNVAPNAAASTRMPEFSIDDLEVCAVPEPSTFGLLGLSSLGLLARRRRA